MVRRLGAPLAIRTTGADVSDHRLILPLWRSTSRVGGKPGRPRELPDVLYAQRDYYNESTRLLLRWLGIGPWIIKRDTLPTAAGKVCWVGEWTIGWTKRLRRM